MTVLNVNDLFQWGPLDCALQTIHYSSWAGVQHLRRDLDFSWPKTVLVFKGRQATWFNENSRLVELGKEMIAKLILNNKNHKEVQKLWNFRIKKLHHVIKKIDKFQLQKLKDDVLLKLYEEFVASYYNFWSIGMLAEPVNFGGEALLKEELHKTIKEKNFNEVFLALTSPTKLSFFAEEELELLKIAKNKALGQLKKHAKNHFWTLNSYYETFVLDEQYFKKIIDENWNDKKKVNAAIKHLRTYPRETIAKKKAVFKRYKFNKAVQKYSSIVDEFICFQDERKKNNWIANHYIDLFCKEFARRKNIEDFQDLKYLTAEEIIRSYSFLVDLINTARERRQLNVAVYYDTNPSCYEIFTGEPAEQIYEQLFPQSIESIKEVSGIVVSKPVQKITGIVKILSGPTELDKLKHGEILVSPMTSPDYILAMKRAKAIITDVGGMTSHAALVSRELKIPCIVATKFATKVFKDGDFVEMDLENGIVRKAT